MRLVVLDHRVTSSGDNSLILLVGICPPFKTFITIEVGVRCDAEIECNLHTTLSRLIFPMTARDFPPDESDFQVIPKHGLQGCIIYFSKSKRE